MSNCVGEGESGGSFFSSALRSLYNRIGIVEHLGF